MTFHDVRSAYLAAAAVAAERIATPAVAGVWSTESVLEGMSVGALASHLGRSVLQVEWFLDGPITFNAVVSPVTYYARIRDSQDPDSDLNTGVRARSDETAASGWQAVVDATAAALGRLQQRLPDEPDDRRVAILHRPGEEMLLDDYLRTRCVELAVHTEDLALSVGSEVRSPAEAASIAVELLVAAARARHGDTSVLHALARRERDTEQALRVL